MRILYCGLPIGREELQKRKQYFSDIFSLYFVEKKFDKKGINHSNYILLSSFPENEESIFMIEGHIGSVYKFIESNEEMIYEKNIVIATCNFNKIKKIKDKKMYAAISNNGFTDVYDGSEWGFEFPMTESAIRLYNSKKKTALSKISEAYLEVK